jgi:hypothetical protein
MADRAIRGKTGRNAEGYGGMKRALLRFFNFVARPFRKKELPRVSSFLLAAVDLAEQYENKKEGRINVKRRDK